MAKKLIFLSLILVVLLAACAQPTPEAPPEEAAPEEPAEEAMPEDLTGTVKFYKGPFGPDEVAQQEANIALFNEEYPNVKVTFETFDWPTQEAQITAALAGATHDLIYIPEGMYPKFAYEGGPLEDLSWCVDDPAWA